MDIKEQAAAFLAQKRIAVVGVSREQGTGNGIFTSLRGRGYEVFPVNPNATEVMGEPCYPTLQAIPGGVDAAVIVTRPEVTEAVVRDCAEAGVSHVWMHYNALFGAGNSSVSDAAVAYCREHNIDVIAGGCPLMFGEGADVGHKCMRWILGVTGGLPRRS
ncbi:MAG TPA: CoA-binding protein [Caldilineaceae bacterium]|nr:CoA-binding protein [Caldilineaceae bacterium]